MPFSLLTAIAPSVVGGFLSARENRKARDAARVDDATRFVRLREGAEAGGFNPLTALMYGGTGSAMPNTAPLSLAPFAMEGVRAAAAEITGEAAQERAQAALQTRLAELQLEQLEAEASAFNRGLRDGVSGRGSSAGVPWSQGGTGVGEPAYTVSNPERTSVRFAGIDVDPSHSFSDAEEIEKRYGDVVQNISGILNLNADVYETTGRGLAAHAGEAFNDRLRAAREHRALYGSTRIPAGSLLDDVNHPADLTPPTVVSPVGGLGILEPFNAAPSRPIPGNPLRSSGFQF